jgi:hypothetical protein
VHRATQKDEPSTEGMALKSAARRLDVIRLNQNLTFQKFYGIINYKIKERKKIDLWQKKLVKQRARS